MKPALWIAKINPVLFSVLAVGALVFGSVWLAPAAPAFADSGTPPAVTPGARAANAEARLQKAYQQEQKALTQQTDNLTKANAAAAKAQTWIDTEKAKGVDTSAVEAALAAFKAKIATAQTSHDTAANILSTHAGFDGGGKVTDAAQAQQTVTSAHQALSDARTVLVGAGQDLREALKAARQTVTLENQLAREQKALTQQQTTLDNANKVVTQVQTYIANQKAKGQDPSTLEAALATFQQQLATAQTSHATAANLLSAHAGFDDSGHVTNADQAKQTLTDAHQALETARTTLKQAGEDLRKALQDYRQTHKPTATPAAPAPTATPNV